MQKWQSAAIQRSISIGLVITALLFLLELGYPASAPRAVAMPGWIAIIMMCGFEGCGQSILPWIVFGIVNFAAYSIASFLIIVIIGAFRFHPENSSDKGN
jgi:hypothetical protein